MLGLCENKVLLRIIKEYADGITMIYSMVTKYIDVFVEGVYHSSVYCPEAFGVFCFTDMKYRELLEADECPALKSVRAIFLEVSTEQK